MSPTLSLTTLLTTLLLAHTALALPFGGWWHKGSWGNGTAPSFPTSFPTATGGAAPTGWLQRKEAHAFGHKSFPTGFLSGFPTGFPAGFPTGFPTAYPTGFPTAFPTAHPDHKRNASPEPQPEPEHEIAAAAPVDKRFQGPVKGLKPRFWWPHHHTPHGGDKPTPTAASTGFSTGFSTGGAEKSPIGTGLPTGYPTGFPTGAPTAFPTAWY